MKKMKMFDWNQWLLVVVPIVVVGVYFFWFLLVETSLSKSSGDWGTFGDYVGGLLNPLVGVLALIWLRRSVRIQKKELKKTNKSLKKRNYSASEWLTVLIYRSTVVLR